jgi:hypothetical protein
MAFVFPLLGDDTIIMNQALAITGLLLCTLLVSVPHAEKRIGGIINKDVRLTPDEGPYLVDRDLLITRTGRLTVMAGTRLLVGKPLYYDDSIPQVDNFDSQMVSIKVQGIMRFLGKRTNRIAISSANRNRNQCSWYGIVIQNTGEAFNEIAFTDIADACYGITVENARPVIRNSIIEFNNIGIRCLPRGNARVSNCIISSNVATGILISGSSPAIYNSIIAYNQNNGVWCDQASEIDLKYNCLFGNPDGNLLDCNPELGTLKKVNENKDSIDARSNIFKDPGFAGSPSDSSAGARDISRATDIKKVTDTTLARATMAKHADTAQSENALQVEPRTGQHRYTLSKYSPCRNAGNPAKEFRDPDGSRNDIGIFGGPDFMEIKKE